MSLSCNAFWYIEAYVGRWLGNIDHYDMILTYSSWKNTPKIRISSEMQLTKQTADFNEVVFIIATSLNAKNEKDVTFYCWDYINYLFIIY